jgi:hypothetical protein
MRDGPLSTSSIVIGTSSLGRDDAVDSPPILAFLAEHVCHAGAGSVRAMRDARARGLMRMLPHQVSWADFVRLFGAVVRETTGLCWEGRVRAQSSVRLAMQRACRPRVRYFLAALGARAQMPASAPCAPCTAGPELVAAVAAAEARLGPFAPIAGLN